MTTNTTSKRRLPHSRLLISAAMLVALAGAGCDGLDQDQVTLAKAGDKINAMSVAGANPVPTLSSRAQDLKKIIDDLKPLVERKDPSTSSAAGGLLARATAALGDLSARAAADEERQFLNQAHIVRAKLDQWISQNSVAKALESYNPSKDLAELDKQIADKGAQAQKLEGDKAAQEAKVAQIRAQAETLRGQAKARRTDEANLRKQGEGMSQTARADLVTRAAAISREADALDRQAAETMALADKEAPVVAELANQAERWRRQADALAKAKTDLEQRMNVARQQAAAAKADAQKVGAEIKTELATLESRRNAADMPMNEAVKNFTAAVRQAKDAGKDAPRDTRTALGISAGTFQQSLGDVLSTRARAMASYSDLMRALAGAEPALPEASELSSKATKASEDAKSAREEAKKAYESAKSAYESSGASGDVKAKLEQLKTAMEALLAEPKAAEPAPAGDAPAGEAASSLTPEQANQIRDELKAAIEAAKADPAAFQAMFKPKGNAAQKIFDDSNALQAKMKALDEAAQAKFGKSMKEIASASNDPQARAFAESDSMEKGMSMMIPDGAKITPTSETSAKISSPMGAPIEAKKVDGQWTVEMQIPEPLIMMFGPILGGMNKALDSVTANVNEGKYATGEDMLKDLAKVMQDSMGGAIPGMGGGGGGKP